jgi:2-C-methyl-D-erythritol 4-phosphate cytidylyltransferase
MSVSAIILAGGKGERFGKEKQFVEFQGMALWRHVYYKCAESKVFERIVVVGVPPYNRYDFPGTIFIEKGGKTRQDSVFYGLHRIGPVDRVVILEAARPLVNVDQIKAIANHKGDSVSFVAPAVETVLFRGEHLDRRECEILQVPQAFNAHMLIEAHMRTCEKDATDDTILMRQQWGIQPDLLPGSRNLYKVTYPHDLKVLELIDEDINNGG